MSAKESNAVSIESGAYIIGTALAAGCVKNSIISNKSVANVHVYFIILVAGVQRRIALPPMLRIVISFGYRTLVTT